MSALQFERAQSTGSGLYEARNCMDYSCNKAGRWRMFIMGVEVGRCCTMHRNKLTKSWDEASGVAEQREATVAA